MQVDIQHRVTVTLTAAEYDRLLQGKSLEITPSMVWGKDTTREIVVTRGG